MSAIRSTFIAADGRLRAVWRLSAAILAWYALYALSAFGISNLLIRLFESWGVTSANLSLAPAWFKYLVSYQTQLFHVSAALPAALVGWLLARKSGRTGTSAVHTAAWAALGFFGSVSAATLLALIFQLTDSLRAVSARVSFSPDIILMLAAYLIAAAAEGQLAFGYIREMTLKRGGRVPSYAAAAAMFCAMTGFSSGAVGVVNTVLLALVLCCIAEKGGVWASVGARAGWLWAVNSLSGFPGGGVSLQTLYPVSENLLTGGDAGPMSGLAFTFFCGLILYFALCRPALRGLKRRVITPPAE